MARVALIADSEDAVTSVVDGLRHAGLDVMVVTGAGARPPVTSSVDMVVVDLEHSSLSAAQAVKYVRSALGAWKLTYLYSGLTEGNLAEEVRSAQASGYICKEWGMDRLVDTLQRGLRQGKDHATSEQFVLKMARGSSAQKIATDDASASVPNISVGGGGLAEALSQLSNALTTDQAAQRNAAKPPAARRPPGLGTGTANAGQSAEPAHVQQAENELDDDDMLSQLASAANLRRTQIHDLIKQAAGESSAASALHAIGQKLEDWFGEAKMLGLGQLAGVARRLQEVVYEWTAGTFHAETSGAQLASWTDRLAKATEQIAQAVPAESVSQDLSELHREICGELGGRGGTEIATGDFLNVPQAADIIIFDDSPLIRRVLAKKLADRGHNVQSAATNAEFERLLGEVTPHLIVLDINMPEITGDAVCERLRSRDFDRRPTVIFVSSLAESTLSPLAMRAGADGCISKQRGVDEILRYVEGALANAP